MTNTKDILEKEKRSVKIGNYDDIAFVSTWNQAIDRLVPIVEKLVERAKQEGYASGYKQGKFDGEECDAKNNCKKSLVHVDDVKKALQQYGESVREEERGRIINIVKTSKDAFMVPATEKRFIKTISTKQDNQ